MATLFEVQKAADGLSSEERAGLAAHLIATLPSPPLGPDDEEIDRRDAEMDSGAVTALSHEEFLSAVGPK